jgi:hypothetical protein
MRNWLKKMYLASRLRVHGICPKHGCKLREGVGCQPWCHSCWQETLCNRAAAEEAWIVREEKRVAAMLEEYRKL